MRQVHKATGDGFCGDGRADTPITCGPDIDKSSKRHICLDPEDVRFEDCQLSKVSAVGSIILNCVGLGKQQRYKGRDRNIDFRLTEMCRVFYCRWAGCDRGAGRSVGALQSKPGAFLLQPVPLWQHFLSFLLVSFPSHLYVRPNSRSLAMKRYCAEYAI
jgi:hypothetical protein